MTLKEQTMTLTHTMTLKQTMTLKENGKKIKAANGRRLNRTLRVVKLLATKITAHNKEDQIAGTLHPWENLCQRQLPDNILVQYEVENKIDQVIRHNNTGPKTFMIVVLHR